MSKSITPCANSVFEQPWWLDITAPGKWHEVTIEKNGKVIARWPYVIEKGKIVNPPMTQTLGIWMEPSLKEPARGNSHLNHQKAVIFELTEKLPEHVSVNVTLDSSLSYVLPFRWKGFRITPSFSYRLEDIKNIEDIDQKIASKTVQRHVKAAEKVVIAADNSQNGIEHMLDLNRMTFARQGRKPPKDEALLKKIMEGSIENNCGQILLALGSDGRAHSGAFFLYDEKTCYYLLGGQDPEFKNDGSMNLVLRKGIDFAKDKSQNFDFEGSMIEGIENFFRQYGGRQITNYTVTRQSLFADILEVLKPRIKRMIGYKM